MAIIQYQGVTAQPADTLTVYLTGTLNKATLYEDAIGTALGNPFTSDITTGDYEFFAEDVIYDIVDTTGS